MTSSISTRCDRSEKYDFKRCTTTMQYKHTDFYSVVM